MKKYKTNKILIYSHNNQYNSKIFNLIKKDIKNKFIVSNIITIDNSDLESLQNNFQSAKIDEFQTLLNPQKKININHKEFLKIKHCKLLFYKMLDYLKVDETYFTIKEKENAFKYYSSIILEYFKNNEFNLVFFSHVPHSFFEVLFVQICKIKKIKVIFTRAFPIPGFYYFESDLFETTFDNSRKNINLTKIHPAFNKFFKEAKSKYNLMTINKNIWVDYSLIKNMINSKNYFFLKLKYKTQRLSLYFFRCIIINFKFFFKFLSDILLNNNFINLKKYYFIEGLFKKKELNSIQTKIKRTELEKIFLFSDLKKLELIIQYFKLCKKINLKEKYIFFPLWFQPSATTYPFAGKNIDYLNCIKKLSKSIPAHWKIYIKENPDIFNLNRHAWFKGSYVRNKNFYKNISRIKNVKLVSFDVPDFKLIDCSQATASQADKYGLISILRNKINFNFSNSIQKYCEGTIIMNNQRNLKNKFKNLKKNASIDKKKILLFYRNLSNRLFYRSTIIGFNKYESKTEFTKISKLLKKELLKTKLNEN